MRLRALFQDLSSITGPTNLKVSSMDRVKSFMGFMIKIIDIEVTVIIDEDSEIIVH